MSATDVLTVIGAVLLPACAFMYGTYRNMKKDYFVKQEKIEKQLDKLETATAKASESFARVHTRVDNLANDQQKLETAVEVRMDRFSDKLEKIYDLLLEQSVGR